MTVLTTSKIWRRAAALAHTRMPDLTDEERANVRKALAFLRVRSGGYVKLASALGILPKQVMKAGAKRGKPSVALALRLARAAKVPVESILRGEWPPEGACPHCGR